MASINNRGVVAFAATLTGGGSGIFTVSGGGGGGEIVVDGASGPFQEISSHPDINSSGAICFYAALKSGGRGVFLARTGEVIQIAESAGPLGPTMNEAGAVAFRAIGTGQAGEIEGIYAWQKGHAAPIAQTGEYFSAFHGLAVINTHGVVAICADLKSGGQAIHIGNGARTTTILETGDRFTSLGAFPILDDAQNVAFVANLAAGGSGLFIATDNGVSKVLDTNGPFESFRGALINNSGRLIFYATPKGGTIGIFTGPNPARDCLFSLGSPLFGSTVADFALNPVSMNDSGQLAIRVALADKRQFILRADPL